MIKLFKSLSGFLLMLMLLIVVAAAVLFSVLNPNDYRDHITAIVKDKIGRDLELQGDLSLSVFPWLGIHAQRLSLSQPEAIGGEMLSVQTAQLRVKLLPLLSKRFEIDTVVLERPKVTLVTLKSGINSFTGLVSTAENPVKSKLSDNADAAVVLLIQGVEINNGDISWDDRAAGQRYQIQALNFSSGNLVGDGFARLNASGVVVGAGKQEETVLQFFANTRIDTTSLQVFAQNIKVELQQGQKNLELEAQNFELDQTTGITMQGVQVLAEVNLTADNGAQEAVTFTTRLGSLNHNLTSGLLSANAGNLTLKMQRASAGNIDLRGTFANLGFNAQTSDLRVNEFVAQGEVTDSMLVTTGPIMFSSQLGVLGHNLESGLLSASAARLTIKAQADDFPNIDLVGSLPRLKFDTQTSQFSADELAVRGDVDNRPLRVTAAKIKADLESQKANIRTLQLDSNDLSARMNQLQISQLIENPAVTGNLDIKQFNLADLLKELGIDYAPRDTGVLKVMSARSSFTASDSRFKLSQLQLQLDSSNLSGDFAVEDYENPRFAFDLALDQLNLDRYLPASETQQEAARNSETEGSAPLTVPMGLLKKVTANGRFRAGHWVSAGLELNSIDVQIVSDQGELTITPNAGLYEGNLAGEIVFSQSGDRSNLKIQNQIDLVNLAKFLNAANLTDQISGIGSLDLDMLISEENGIQNKQGSIKLFAKKGVITGIDIVDIIGDINQRYKEFLGKEQTETGLAAATDQTRFDELLGTFFLNDQTLSNNDFSLKAPLFNILGEGEIDLAEEQIDYLVNVLVVDTSDASGGEVLNRLKGLTIPIRLSGSLFAPKYTLDIKALSESLAAREIKRRKSAYLEEKLGIEEGGELSTKELLQQLLLDKITKKDREQTAENPVESEPTTVSTERSEDESYPPVFDADENQDSQQSDKVADVDANPDAQPQPTDNKAESAKKQIENDLKRLLEEVFQ